MITILFILVHIVNNSLLHWRVGYWQYHIAYAGERLCEDHLRLIGTSCVNKK